MGSKLMLIKSMANQPYVVTLDNLFNACTGLVYTYINCEDITGFQEGVKREFGLIKVQLASWIKPRNMPAKPLILTFNRVLPEFIQIAREQGKTKVYPYIPSPLRCGKCQQYTSKYCESDVVVCVKCCLNHLTVVCKSLDLKCFHCSEAHETGTGSKLCHMEIMEREIKTIQTFRKTSRKQAIVLMQKANPEYQLHYSGAVSLNI